MNFQEKAHNCKHENVSPDYYAVIRCSTPYCHGGGEYHCLDCGAYVSECPCGANDGISGWPAKRWEG